MNRFSIDFIEEDTQSVLIALQTPLEIHRLAYMLNRHLKTKFVRIREGLYDYENKVGYGWCQWKKDNEEIWHIIANQHKEITLYGLFDSLEKVSFLIKEYKKMNYFLKIDNVSTIFSVDKIVEDLQQIKEIDFLHLVELNSLKSKYKLIVC